MKSLTDLAGNLDVSTAQVLTALRIVASRAGVDEIVEWTEKELEGYQMEDDLPEHRIWKLSIKASLHNPLQGSIQDVHLGDLAVEEEFRRQATTNYCRDGIWQLESMLSDQGNQRFGVEHPNLAQLINDGKLVGEGWICTHANAEFSSIRLKTVINKARQTALKFCLECEKKGIDLRWGDDENTTPEERDKWLKMITEESTKNVLRTAWDTVLKSIFGGGL